TRFRRAPTTETARDEEDAKQALPEEKGSYLESSNGSMVLIIVACCIIAFILIMAFFSYRHIKETQDHQRARDTRLISHWRTSIGEETTQIGPQRPNLGDIVATSEIGPARKKKNKPKPGPEVDLNALLGIPAPASSPRQAERGSVLEQARRRSPTRTNY
ncbi:MAG: hypothetical protein SGCHY_004686, partial [Lobulomycetales sp.]